MAVAIVLAIAALVGCSQHDDSDPQGGRSGLIIYTDHLTGCQYLGRLSLNGGPEPMTPRMNKDGTQVCVTNASER